MAGGIFLTCWHSDAVSGINILININSGTGIKKKKFLGDSNVGYEER